MLHCSFHQNVTIYTVNSQLAKGNTYTSLQYGLFHILKIAISRMVKD